MPPIIANATAATIVLLTIVHLPFGPPADAGPRPNELRFRCPGKIDCTFGVGRAELDPADLRATMLRLMPDAASLNETLRSIRQSTRRLDFLSAYDQACHALETWPDELQLEYEAIFALANLGAIAGATQRLNRLEQDRIDKAEPDLALDLKTLRARLLKDKALRQQGAERRRTALEAAAAYAAADASGGSYYPAINAASLSALSGDLTAAKDHAERALARARSQPPDVWTMFTEAEALLILGDVDAAGDAYARGATAAGENMRAI
ncbi:MAG TPA: tetratricopeptide repeat-containing protein, partial [Acidisphaera sp.]|nr:tetratricopeptide repeat-containing protein [Acidisphaera sp.]